MRKLLFLAMILLLFAIIACNTTADKITFKGHTVWDHLSSRDGDVPYAEVGEQVSTLIFDVDQDGLSDYIIAGWGKSSMVWMKRSADGWSRYVVENGTEYIEAGGDVADIDGDLDIVQDGDWRTLKEVWWWENPAPDFDPQTAWPYASG